MNFIDFLLIIAFSHYALVLIVVSALYLGWPLLEKNGGRYALAELCSFYFFNITHPLGFLAPKRFKLSLHANDADPRNTPIVFLHGYMMNGFCMLPMRLYLMLHGYRRLYSLNLRRPFSNIEAFGWQFRDFLLQVEQENPGKKVMIVAHSMGGIVSCQAMQDKRIARLVQGVITLGTPFAGSLLSVAGPGQCARQLNPGSNFLAQIASRIKNEVGPKLLSVCSTGDRMVIPYQSSYVAQARHNEVLHGLGHLSLLLSLDVFRKVYWWLFEWQENQIDTSEK